MLRLHEPNATGRFPIERHFDLSGLDGLRDRLLEVDAVALDSSLELRRAADTLSRLLVEAGRDFIITAAGLETPPALPLLMATSPEDLKVVPRIALEADQALGPSATPAMVRAWLDLGAWVCGEPGWNADRGCAQVPLLLTLARMRGKHARAFLARAA